MIKLSSSTSLPLSLSGSALKIIAIISMIIDHCACFLLEPGSLSYEAMRSVGRIAFPVFAFLLAEGAAYTRCRIRYILTILIFGVISEIPWLLLYHDGSHNVFFTLLVGLFAISLFDRLCEHGPLCFGAILGCGITAWLIGSDYDWRGVIMIVLFYMLRQQTINPTLPSGPIQLRNQSLIQLIFTFPLMANYGIFGAVLACSIIVLYNGTRGSIKGTAAKYSFYAFYPGHLLLLSMI